MLYAFFALKFVWIFVPWKPAQPLRVNEMLSLIQLQVLAIFQEIGVNNVLYFLVFGESLLNGEQWFILNGFWLHIDNMNGIQALFVWKVKNWTDFHHHIRLTVFADAVTVVLYNMMKEFNEMDVIPVEQVNWIHQHA